MSMLDDEASLRELPYYKIILKSFLRKQIGTLLEELASQTGEESIVVMADKSSRSSSYLASSKAENFLKKFEKLRNLDIKNEFLLFCLQGLADETRGEKRTVKTAKRKAKNVIKDRNPSKQPKLTDFTCHTEENNSARTDFGNLDLDRLKSRIDCDEMTNTQLCLDNPENEKSNKTIVYNEFDDTFRIKIEPLSDTDTMCDTSNIIFKSESSVEHNSQMGTPSQDSQLLDMSVTPCEPSLDMSFNHTSTPVQTIGPIRFVRKFPPKERTILSLPDKIQIIEEFEMGGEGMSQRKLAEKYRISKTAVGEMLRNRQVLKEQYEFNSNTKRKRFNTNSKFSEVNELVWQWYKVSREKGVQMSGPMIQEKALQVAQQVQAKDFKGSNGWLHSWKNRYNVTTFKDDTGLSPKLNYINDYSKMEGFNPALHTSDATNVIMNLDTIVKSNLLNTSAANKQGTSLQSKSKDCVNSKQSGNDNNTGNIKCKDKFGVSSEDKSVAHSEDESVAPIEDKSEPPCEDKSTTVNEDNSACLSESKNVTIKTEHDQSLILDSDNAINSDQDPIDEKNEKNLAKTYDKIFESALSEYEDIKKNVVE